MDFIKQMQDEKKKHVVVEEIGREFEEITTKFTNLQETIIRNSCNTGKSLVEVNNLMNEAEVEYKKVKAIKENIECPLFFSAITLEVLEILLDNIKNCTNKMRDILKP